MRIGLNTPDPQGISTEKAKTGSTASPNSVAQAGDSATVVRDTVHLSSLASRALQLPEIRQDKIDSIRQQIKSGEYKLDAHATAAAMLTE
jgi:flagellar biosynthesis anti-sigma factor FlgM